MLTSEALHAALPQKFWARVNKNGPVPAHAPHLGKCWLWAGVRASKGHGSYNKMKAARFILQVALEKPLGDLFACHRCDNPRCLNPDHLFAGTGSDNMLDAVIKGRHAATRKTHCLNGHPLRDSSGPRDRRKCPICMRDHRRRYREKIAASTLSPTNGRKS